MEDCITDEMGGSEAVLGVATEGWRVEHGVTPMMGMQGYF